MKKVPLQWKLACFLILLGGCIWCIPGMKFSAVFCVFLAVVCIFYRILVLWSEKSIFGNTCKVVFRYALIAGFALLFLLEGYLVYRGTEEYNAVSADAVIVLGAGVNGENPSLVLQSRIDAAREYIRCHPGTCVVLSGGQGPGEAITEAEAMHRALKGEEAVFILEERSTSTEENLLYSKALLEEHGVDTQQARVAVVTNDFHVARACMLAHRQGYGTVFGVGTPVPWWWLQVNYYLREAFALAKDMIF